MPLGGPARARGHHLRGALRAPLGDFPSTAGARRTARWSRACRTSCSTPGRSSRRARRRDREPSRRPRQRGYHSHEHGGTRHGYRARRERGGFVSVLPGAAFVPAAVARVEEAADALAPDPMATVKTSDKAEASARGDRLSARRRRSGPGVAGVSRSRRGVGGERRRARRGFARAARRARKPSSPRGAKRRSKAARTRW